MGANDIAETGKDQREEVLRLRRTLYELLEAVYLAPGIARSAGLCSAYQKAHAEYVASLNDDEAALLEQAALSRLRESGIDIGRIERCDLASAVRSAGSDLLKLVAAQA